MKSFLDENFLLETEASQKLYHEFAADLPIIDYHNHLPPEQIQYNTQFTNLTQAWLAGDHYKWRAMRTNGVDEAYCTGQATDEEKFSQWAQTVPYTMRNPLYHWTHLELKRYFGISTVLDSHSAASIYAEASDMLQSDDFRTNGLLAKMKVEALCTTDDPLDTLAHHQAIKESGQAMKVLPAFRPDKFINIEDQHFTDYLLKLGQLVNFEVTDFDTLKRALRERIVYFNAIGCKVSDHGLAELPVADFQEEEANRIVQNKLAGSLLSEDNIMLYKSAILFTLGQLYAEFGWVQQFHLGALRNNNLRALHTLGPDTGWDSIGDNKHAAALSKFLGKLDADNQLAKTVIYNLNPADNYVFGTMIGNFNDGSLAGKIQFGSGWWFLDQKQGMEEQINTLSNVGLLSRFIGMTTDSRSFLSFPRHEYFRRILCNLFGKDIKNGELPNDINWIGKLVQDICYYNSKHYFNL